MTQENNSDSMPVGAEHISPRFYGIIHENVARQGYMQRTLAKFYTDTDEMDGRGVNTSALRTAKEKVMAGINALGDACQTVLDQDYMTQADKDRIAELEDEYHAALDEYGQTYDECVHGPGPTIPEGAERLTAEFNAWAHMALEAQFEAQIGLALFNDSADGMDRWGVDTSTLRQVKKQATDAINTLADSYQAALEQGYVTYDEKLYIDLASKKVGNANRALQLEMIERVHEANRKAAASLAA